MIKQPNKFLVLIRDKGNEVNRDKIRSSIAIIIPNIVKNGKIQSVIDSMYDIVILITQQISLTKVNLLFHTILSSYKILNFLNCLFNLSFFIYRIWKPKNH